MLSMICFRQDEEEAIELNFENMIMKPGDIGFTSKRPLLFGYWEIKGK
jgi:hypothetical protein